MQKLLYVVLMEIQKLLHYFTDHEVSVITSYPLGDIIYNHDAVGWISKWALELMGHDIRYIPHTAIMSLPNRENPSSSMSWQATTW